MRRREFITFLGGMTVTWPFGARAQQRAQIARIGVLMSAGADDPEGKARIAAFREGLQKLGWTEGQNVRLEVRWSAGDAELERKFAVELAKLAPVRQRLHEGDRLRCFGGARRNRCGFALSWRHHMAFDRGNRRCHMGCKSVVWPLLIESWSLCVQ